MAREGRSRRPAPDADVHDREPNAPCARVHNRMPVMLAPEQWNGWLGTAEERDALLKPFPADDMTMWPVSKAVGSVKNTRAELVERIEVSASQ